MQLVSVELLRSLDDIVITIKNCLFIKIKYLCILTTFLGNIRSIKGFKISHQRAIFLLISEILWEGNNSWSRYIFWYFQTLFWHLSKHNRHLRLIIHLPWYWMTINENSQDVFKNATSLINGRHENMITLLGIMRLHHNMLNLFTFRILTTTSSA